MSLGIDVNTNLSQAQKDIDNFAKSSRTALTSLSLVAQDLPYGFIGIQNNLPAVIQSFGELTTKAGGVSGALKELGSALIGPSGIFLAFSAATAGVTYLIKEYGSLGAAIDALLGKSYSWTKALNDSSKAQKEFAEQTRNGNEIANDASATYAASAVKLQALSEIVLDATNSDLQRKNALEQIKELDKERFKNFNIEKGALEGLTIAVDDYTQSLINNAVAKEYEKEIGKSTKAYYDQLDVLLDLQDRLDKLNSKYPDLAENAAEFNKQQADQAKINATLFAPVRVFNTVQTKQFGKETEKRIEEFNALNAEITKLGDDIKNNTFPSLTKLQQKLKDITKVGLDTFIPKPDKSAQEALEKRNKELTDGFIEFYKSSSKLQDAANRAEYDATIALQTDRNKELLQLYTKYQEDLKALQLAGFTNSTNITEAYNKQRLEINAKYDAEEAKRRDKIIKEAGKAELDAYLATLSDRDAELFKREIKFYQDLAAVKKAGTTDFTLIEEGYRLDRLKINQKYDEKELRDFEKQQNKLKKQFNDIRSNLQNVFFNPLSDIFEKFLEDGKFTFEEFRKVVINNIKKMVAQLAATQILNTLASVLSGFTPGGTGSFIGNLLSGNLGGSMNRSGFEASSVAAPNIGGLSGGSLAMTGGVNLVLRGSDLVGAINRTNAQISRVG